MTKSKKKFENVEFSPEDIELWLDTSHDGRGFRCVRGEFVTFLRKGRIAREVQAHQESGLSRSMLCMIPKQDTIRLDFVNDVVSFT